MSLLETTMQNSGTIVTAKIIAMTNKLITFITQDGQRLLIPITNQEREDSLFLPTLKDIWKAGLWIPVNKKMHQLLQYDWLTSPVTVEA